MNPMLTISPEQQNARMSVERTVLTDLLDAALKGDFSKIQSTVKTYLLKNNDLSITDVVSQFKDAQKRTLIHFACQSPASSNSDGGLDIVEQILQWLPSQSVGSILRLKDRDGMTPLMLAAHHHDKFIAERRILAILRADSNSSPSKLGLARSKTGATALHYAAGAGATKTTIASLINAGKVALNTFSNNGGCPLYFACSSSADQRETIKALIEAGADVNASTEKIPPPIFLALAAGNQFHVNCLIEYDVFKSMEYLLQPGSISIFHMAADMNLPGILAKLLGKTDEFAKANLKNADGYTPLDLATREKHVGCVVLLLSAQKGSAIDEMEAQKYIEHWHEQNPVGSYKTSKPMEEPTQAETCSSIDDKIKKRAEEEILSIKEMASKKPITIEQKQAAIALKEKGNSHFARQEWDQAIIEYTSAIQTDPTDATFYANRSACYIQLKMPEKGLHDATIAHSLKPDWPKTSYRRAVAYFELGNYEEAALAAWEGLQQDPGNTELKSLLQKSVKKGRKDFLSKKT